MLINPPLFPLLIDVPFNNNKEINGIPLYAKPFILASLLKEKTKALIITKEGISERLASDLSYFIPDTYLFPLADTACDISEIRRILKRIKEGKRTILVGGVLSILKEIPSPDTLFQDGLILLPDEEIGFSKTIEALNKMGYIRSKRADEKGLFAVRGGILDIWPINYEYPLRCEFEEDKILSLRLFDPISYLSFKNLEASSISSCFSPKTSSIFDYIFEEIVLDEEDELKEEVENGGFVWDDIRKRIKSPYLLSSHNEGAFNISQPLSFAGRIDECLLYLKSHFKKKTIVICCSYEGQGKRMKDLLEDADIPCSERIIQGGISIVIAPISSGFSLDNLIVITHNEIFKKPQLLFKRRPPRKITPISSITELNVGDYAVHINYGIGRYLGIKSLYSCGRIRDFLVLEYKDNDKLYVPSERIDLVEKYVGGANPPLNRLGDGTWERTKTKVSLSTLEYAKRLLSLYAEREASKGHKFSPDTIWQKQLEAGFIYLETPDQIRAIQEIKEDMEREKPMDRLLVGDVGFGKTEVAIRASFKAVMDGFQVAILAPTTILAHQHYNTFCERMSGFPINIGLISRAKKKEQIKEIIKGLKNGHLDIVIGTHRLLQKDISFKNLGLLIIDDEHRFGVLQKERLKEFKKNIDCLSISATPIPRTLYLALAGIRDISIINTPPIGREEIVTYITEFNPEIIERAITRELERGGQVFFVHNTISTMSEMADYIKALIPGIKIKIAHGRLKGSALDEVMLDFLDKKIDLLLSTSIIASGIDIPSCNTIIINFSSEFGLADIYQLRGRVGRSNIRAYCYLLYPDKKRLKEKEKQRLSAIQRFFSLGSSFSLALEDLNMRGAGNILGKEQSGNIKSVGLSLYTSLLKEAVCKIKGIKEKKEGIVFPKEIEEDAFIPEWYIEDQAERFSIYKRLSSSYSPKQLKDEMEDKFGKLPKETLRLLEMYEK